MAKRAGLEEVNAEIVVCRKCPRLVAYREQVAQEKRRAFADSEYWGRPVPGFGDAQARLVILGLAPAAHGANRTGRIFTGDRSGDFLFRALYRAGFANQARSERPGDGLELKDAYVTAAARCAPPENRPLPNELDNCRGYLEAELDLLRPKAILALGGIALRAYLQILKGRGLISSYAGFPFRHGAEYALPGKLPRVFASYHPSQQNTFTGRLTPAMLERVLQRIRNYVER